MIRIESEKTIGERIRNRRDELNMTQKELGDALHLSISAISHIERGKSSLSMDLVMPLCLKLEITPNELFGYKVKTIEEILDRCSISDKRKISLVLEVVYEQFLALKN